MELFKFTGVILSEPKGYSALCPELEVASAGQTIEEARSMLLEAATRYLEGAIEDSLPYLRPVPAAQDPRNVSPDDVVDIFRFAVDVAVTVHV